MPVSALDYMLHDIFSKRQKRLRGELPDVYQYTVVPPQFRVQLIHVLGDVFGSDPIERGERHGHRCTLEYFTTFRDALCREYGRFKLVDHGRGDARDDVFEFLRVTDDVEQVLDVIEIAFRTALVAHAKDPQFRISSLPKMTAEAAITELNARFREHGIGFQFESNEIVRVDSQVLHEEVVKPALYLLKEKRFAGANGEFLKAHEHYRHGRNTEAVNECLKALESTLKVICQTQRWPFKETDAAKTLLDIVFAKGLVPSYLQSEFAGLRSILESGVPTVRSRTSAHGAGVAPKDVPPFLASFVLHMTAASIVFLVEAEKQRSES